MEKIKKKVKNYKNMLTGILVLLIIIGVTLIFVKSQKNTSDKITNNKKVVKFNEIFTKENEKYSNDDNGFMYSATIKPLEKEDVYLENLCVNILDETNGTILSYSESINSNLNKTTGYDLSFSSSKLDKTVSKVNVSLCEQEE